MIRFFARYRVTLGLLLALLALWLARPSMRSWVLGGILIVAGEALRIWAAGHLRKGELVTTTGPYGLVRHPLYLGSTIMGLGFIVASRSVVVALLAAAYMTVTFIAAIRAEESWLSQRFPEDYRAYREGTRSEKAGGFNLDRVIRNGEHKTMLGMVVVMALLWWRSQT